MKSRMDIHHGGPSSAQSFRAILDETGGKINLFFGDGRTSEIINGCRDAPIELMCPSEDGRVLWCSLFGGGQRFFETATGRPLVFKTKGKKNKRQEYQPKFYA